MLGDRLGDKSGLRKKFGCDPVYLRTPLWVKLHSKVQIFGINSLVTDPCNDLLASANIVASRESQSQKSA